MPGFGDEEVLGVYEREHLAESPSLLVVGGRTVSVVTRYWGEPPPDLGLNLHTASMGWWDSGVWPCYGGGGHVGRVDYRWVGEGTLDDAPRVTNHIEKHFLGLGADDRLSPAQDAELTARFGPPVIVGASLGERLGGTLFVWRHHLAVAPAVLLPLGFVASRRRLWRSPCEYTLDRGVVGLAGVGMIIVTLLVGHFGAESWFGMVVGFAVATGVAWLSRSVVALLAAGLAADWLLGAAFDTRSGWYQLAGVILLLMGAGALVWTRGHWSRWPASFAVIAGWILLLGAWEAPIYLRASLIAAIVVGIAWWIRGQRVTPQVEPQVEPISDRN